MPVDNVPKNIWNNALNIQTALKSIEMFKFESKQTWDWLMIFKALLQEKSKYIMWHQIVGHVRVMRFS